MAAESGGLVRKRCPKYSPVGETSFLRVQRRKRNGLCHLSHLFEKQVLLSAVDSGWKKQSLSKGNFFQPEVKPRSQTGKELEEKAWVWRERKEPFTPLVSKNRISMPVTVHPPKHSSNEMIHLWQIFICPVWKLDALLIYICMLSWFARASKHISERSHLKQILVRTCPPPHTPSDVIIDNLEPWYLLPSLGPYAVFLIPSWNCFWGSKMAPSCTSTNQSLIPQPTHLVQILGRKHSDLTNAH